MADEAQSEPHNQAREDAAIAQVIERMWVRFLPDIRERVVVLEQAAAALSTGAISSDQCAAAYAAAHKLAGTLGTFNLKRGTELARELETIFSDDGGVNALSAERIPTAVAEIRTMIENRPRAL